MSDIQQILDEMNNKFPRWLMEGLARSPEVKNIESSLIKMAKLNTDANKGLKGLSNTTTKLDKNLKDFDAIVGKTAKDFDEMSEASDDLSKAHKNLSKSLLGVTRINFKIINDKRISKRKCFRCSCRFII